MVTVLSGATACGSATLTVPSDPDGTLDQIRGETLRVGVSPNPPWTDWPDGTGAEPVGSEVELVAQFAAHLDAAIDWEAGGEEVLVGQLERGDLDLIIGGLTAQSPWSDRASLTYRYTVSSDPDGAEQQHVMAVPLGENAFLVELEHFLLDQDLPR